MPTKDKVFLFERYILSDIKIIINRINKKKLKRPNFMKTKYSNLLINTYKFNYVRRWIVSLISVISKKGKDVKFANYIGSVIKKIKLKYNLFRFFSIIEANLIIVFNTFKKRIAGRNIIVPTGLSHYKRVNAMSKLIISSLKLRKEKLFTDRLFNELIDAYNKKGLSINKKLNYTKQLKDIITNIRFLNEKY